MKKKWLLPLAAAAVAVCTAVSGCAAPNKNTVEQGGKTVFPVSTYEDDLPKYMGDVMPFYDDGVMNIYHLQDTVGTNPVFYHPIARLTTSDYVNYTDCGISLDFDDAANNPDAAKSPDAALGTGSVIKDKQGNYHFFYTGHNDHGQEEGLRFNEVIRHAKSYDNQQTWLKDAEDENKNHELNLYGDCNDFRDPYLYYDEADDLYYMLVTTRANGKGVIKRYSASSLDAPTKEWRDEGIFFSNDGGDFNMECPSYVEFNGYYYLAYSEQGENRVTHYRYRTEKNGEWKRFALDSIDNSGFYAGRLERAGNELYAFAWCARLSGGSTGGFDWGGNLVTHKIIQMSDGELRAVMPDSYKTEFATKVKYRYGGGTNEEYKQISFDGEGFSSRCAERLGRHVTRLNFTICPQDYEGDFGITFALDGVYNNRLGQSLIAFDTKNSRLVCYNSVSSILRYGAPLASVPFVYARGKKYSVDIIIDSEVLTVYLDYTVALTVRLTGIQRKNFAFYSNGSKAGIEEINFYE